MKTDPGRRDFLKLGAAALGTGAVGLPTPSWSAPTGEPRVREYKTLGRTGLKIAAGENACTEFQFAEMLAAGAVDFAQPSITKIGGIAETMATRARAAQAGVAVAHHAPYFGPGYLATLQVLATAPEPEFFEYLYIEREADLFAGMPLPTGGRIAVPDGPGLGLDPDPDVLARYRVDA